MADKSKYETEVSILIILFCKFRFYPDVPEDRATVDFLLNWDLGSLYQSIITAFFPILGFKAAVSDETLAAEKQQFNSKLQFLNDHLVKVTLNWDIRLSILSLRGIFSPVNQ